MGEQRYSVHQDCRPRRREFPPGGEASQRAPLALGHSVVREGGGWLAIPGQY